MRIKDTPKVDRPREKLLKYGAGKLSDAELLAIILKTGTAKHNVLKLADKVLKTLNHKELSAITPEDLMAIEGIKSVKACEILACLELSSRLNQPAAKILTAEDVFNLLIDIRGGKKEHLIALYLDTRNTVIAKEIISVGTLNSNLVHPREVFEPAVKHLAASIIIVHNHPSGDPTPSNSDIELTNRLLEASKIMGIDLLDHIIISADKYISLKEIKQIPY